MLGGLRPGYKFGGKIWGNVTKKILVLQIAGISNMEELRRESLRDNTLVVKIQS